MKRCRLGYAIILAIIVAGCGSGDNHSPRLNDQSRAKVLRSMTPETWEEAMAVLPEIESENPNASPEELGNKLWEKICQSKTRVNGSENRSIVDDFYKLLVDKWLTEAELLLMSKASEYVFVVTIYATVKAWGASRSVFVDELPDTEDKYIQTKSDAFKHSYWSALLCLYVNSRWSESITNAHEIKHPKPGYTLEPDRSMDLHNNAVGRYVYGLYSDEPRTLKSALLDYTYHKVPKGDSSPEELNNLGILIYFRDKEDDYIGPFKIGGDGSDPSLTPPSEPSLLDLMNRNPTSRRQRC